jgi:hypothetical protein
MAKAKKPKKKRAAKYDSKLKIHGSFEDVIKVSVTPKDTKKPTLSIKKKKS